MKHILVAGASGNLGQLVVQELKSQQYRTRALSRAHRDTRADETIIADLSHPAALQRCCHGIDIVISCAGASMNIRNIFDRSSFTSVDYHGNMHLLNEARKSGVKKFIYVSVAGSERLLKTEYCRAHYQFEQALTESGIPYSIIKPTGFFYFLREIVAMAKKGRGIVFGDGSATSNPIHEADVARAVVESVHDTAPVRDIGGPEIFSRRGIVDLAFSVAERKGTIVSVPPALFTALAAPMKVINPRIHALLAFGAAVSVTDGTAPAYGTLRLEEYFRSIR
ncbi:MAG: SDR family oxidoreductase [Bacteroidota bacterium]